ncbi:lipid-binding protein [Flavobacterium sp. XGLA_31]|uniref:lipid-binding protein n=1 Tax=Flavobacterium sp. XGLA_31 TaxID=3447666 RepID=UPI003F3E4853
MKKMKFLKYSLFVSLALALLTLVSCDEGGNPDAGGTTTQKFAGDWHIIALDPDGVTPAFGGDYELFSTYNASSNDENFWVDDHDSWMEIKTKVQANFSNMTFTGQPNSPELYTGGTVTVTNGKILKDAAHSFGGHVVDSIYFEAEFDWDPGTVYKFAGHKRTGFLEDELP